MEARLGVGKQSRRPSMAKCIWRSKASCQSVYDVRDWRIYKRRSFKLGFFSRSFLDDLYYWLTKWHIGCIRNGITKANNWECQTTIFPRTTIAFGSRERNEAWFGVVWNVDRLRFVRIDLLTNSCKEKTLRVSIIEVSRSTVWICVLALRVGASLWEITACGTRKKWIFAFSKGVLVYWFHLTFCFASESEVLLECLSLECLF